MKRGIGHVEDVAPVRDAADIDEVDDGPVDETIADVARCRAGDESEADVLIRLERLRGQQVPREAGDERAAGEREQRARPLKGTEDAAAVPDVCEGEKRRHRA